MTLRAKKPEVNLPRLKVLLFASEGVGKTHFCCSFPDTYYIDTEGLEDYPHFIDMLRANAGDMVYLNDLEEIIKEVKALLSTKHDYKTLVIDSLSFPYAWLAQMEAERLAKKGSEGTEFGANLAKAKRLTFQLGILLSRLDMNVIVVAHERVKYEKSVEVGTTYDITDKMAYSLGTVWNLKLLGSNRKLFVKKSRYKQLQANESLDFNEGYDTIKNIFGEEIFKRESVVRELATNDQIMEIKRLIEVLHLPEDRVNKILTNAKAVTFEEIEKSYMEKLLKSMQKTIQGEAA